MFSYNITWGATKKEVERSNFFLEVPKIWRRFRVALVMSVIIMTGMIVLDSTVNVVPVDWQVNSYDWAVVFPLAYVMQSCSLFEFDGLIDDAPLQDRRRVSCTLPCEFISLLVSKLFDSPYPPSA